MDELVNQLLNENNLFNLASLLKSGKGDRCSDLFVLLSSTLQKEFRMLRLPDPNNQSDIRTVSFMRKGEYAPLEKNNMRLKLCDDIAWFAVRLVTLIMAITASVHINTDMESMISGATPVRIKTMNASMKSPNVSLPQRERMSDELVRAFVAGGQAEFVNVSETGKPDSRNLIYFNKQPSVVIDVTQRIIYAPLRETTSVLGIDIDTLEMSAAAPYPQMMQQAPAAQYQPPAAAQYQPAAAQYQPPMPAPAGQYQPPMMLPAPAGAQYPPQATRRNGRMNSSSSTVQWGYPNSRTTIYSEPIISGMPGRPGGSRRKTRRMLRKQRGGAKMYRITLKDCLTGCNNVVDVFYMDDQGTVMDKEQFEIYSKSRMPGVMRTHTFANYVSNVLDRNTKVPTIVPTEKDVVQSALFEPLNKMDADTYTYFTNAFNEIFHSNEGSSPAQYRAYLLASALDAEGNLKTMYCSDKWAGKRSTNVVAYSLLNSLYFDRLDESMETNTRNECVTTVNGFMGGDRVLTLYGDATKTASDMQSFKDTKFVILPNQLISFCSQHKNAGVRQTGIGDVKVVLTNAHGALRDLYDAHLQSVAKFIVTKVIMPKSRGFSVAPEWQLNPAFVTDARGTKIVLESLIKEARTMIASHYLAVEKIYRGALEKIKGFVEGVSVSEKVVTAA